MIDDLVLNAPLLRKRVPNLTVAARAAGLRAATVSDLCTGKIPVGRAEVRTVAVLATLAGCTLDELVLRSPGMALIETGIKVVDLFAPLVRGGVGGAISRPGLGQLVLIEELLARLGRERGFATVLWLPEESHPLLDEVMPWAAAHARSVDDVVASVDSEDGERDVFVVADRGHVLTGALTIVRDRLRVAGSRPVTFALYDLSGEAANEEGAPFGPLEAVWRFDPSLASRGMYPAVDPVASTSVLLEGAQLEAQHHAVTSAARRLMRRYRELDQLAAIRGSDYVPDGERETFERGRRLEAFLTQPFFVAEAFTKKPGIWVPLAQTLADVRRLLDGQIDDVSAEELRFVGALPHRATPREVPRT
jgi:F-type H+/Na+-transporting ATPase subunit beta